MVNNKIDLKIVKCEINDFTEIDKLFLYVHNIHVNERYDNFKKTDYFFSKEKYENLLQEKDTYLYVVKEKEGEKILGGLQFRIVDVPENFLVYKRKYLFLDIIGVFPQYQKRCVGKNLIEFIKKFKIDHKIDTILLNVWNFNKPALNFYKKLGFKVRHMTLEL